MRQYLLRKALRCQWLPPGPAVSLPISGSRRGNDLAPAGLIPEEALKRRNGPVFLTALGLAILTTVVCSLARCGCECCDAIRSHSERSAAKWQDGQSGRASFEAPRRCRSSAFDGPIDGAEFSDAELLGSYESRFWI